MVHKTSFKLLACVTATNAIVTESFEASYVSCLRYMLSSGNHFSFIKSGHVSCSSSPGYAPDTMWREVLVFLPPGPHSQGSYRHRNQFLHTFSTEHRMSTFLSPRKCAVY